MPGKLLTEIGIRKLKPPERGQVTYWDTAIKHFGLRVSSGGAKTFCILIGPEHRRRRITIAKYPTVDLKDARKEARTRLAQYALGTDYASIGFDEAVELFLETHCRQNNKPSTSFD